VSRLLLLSTLLEAALNRAVAMDPESRARFRALQGRVVGLSIHGIGDLFLHPGEPARLRTAPERAPALWLRASLPVWLRLAAGGSGTAGLSVEGDGELAAAIHQALAGIPIDGEEILAGWLGDIPAHALFRRLRAGSAWGQRVADTLLADLREYLQEEVRQLPSTPAMRAFLDEVDTLAMDTDRLEVRLRRLERSPRHATP